MTTGISQTIIQYSVHALHAGIDNPMSYCSYVDPGIAGENITWDFSNLQFDQPFIGKVNNSQLSSNQALFPKANTELGEFDALFYFDVNKQETDQYGYVSSDGKTKIIYSSPFIKMKYPFGYGDSYSGQLNGSYEYGDLIKGSLSGNYSVEADGSGSLVLPGNIKFENVLRIKTIKKYSILFSNSTQDVEVTTYRWYNSYHRYPILVLTEYSSKTGTSEYINHQAAYNSDAINVSDLQAMAATLDNINLFPIPANNILKLSANAITPGGLYFEISDLSGKPVRFFNNKVTETGTYELDLSREIVGLTPGSYLLIIKNGTEKKTFNFTLVR